MRVPHHDIDVMFLDRWSPRAFTGEDVPVGDLERMLEAARWAPSAFNRQPWRFAYATRRSESWPVFLELLIPFNQSWAQNAGALIFVASVSTFFNAEKQEYETSPTHSFDAGAAWGYLALQARRLNWYAHGMAGFDSERAHSVLGAAPEMRMEAAIAIGRLADKSVLPERMQAREAPSDRMPIADLAQYGRFSGDR
ncbi:MAG: nitroreductase family protein [Caulobacterales bacterium]